MPPGRSRTKAWVRRHQSDPHVRRAQREGYRSRAAYKLIEMDARLSVFRPGMRVLDLGAAPGGWTQVAVERTGKSGTVLAVDRLPMEPCAGARAECLDVGRPGVADDILRLVDGRPFDLVISDIAPDITGVRDTDDANFAGLAERVAEIHARVLRPGGNALTKLFQGGALDPALGLQRALFRKVVAVRPGATRKASREVYLWATDKAGNTAGKDS